MVFGKDHTFEKLAGEERYVWRRALGNRAVRDHLGPKIVIDDPSAASTLLDLAIECSEKRQRLISFCALRATRQQLKKPRCHRRTVANLILAEAKKRRIALDVCEWPGGKAGKVTVDVSPTMPQARGRARITLLFRQWTIAEVAGLPWGTRVTAKSGDNSVTFLSAAAKPSKGKLVVPQFAWDYDNWTKAYREHIVPSGVGS